MLRKKTIHMEEFQEETSSRRISHRVCWSQFETNALSLRRKARRSDSIGNEEKAIDRRVFSPCDEAEMKRTGSRCRVLLRLIFYSRDDDWPLSFGSNAGSLFVVLRELSLKRKQENM